MVYYLSTFDRECRLTFSSESRAICRYIAAKYKDQGPKLIPDPSDLKASILFEQWASVEKDNWDVYASELVGQKYFGP